MYESNAKNLKSGVIYAWHKNSGWYTDGLMKDAYFVNGEYDFPTN
jgi:hypothetical protein